MRTKVRQDVFFSYSVQNDKNVTFGEYTRSGQLQKCI